MNEPMTEAEKRQAYDEDRFQFRMPGVSTIGWTEEDWIRWIDANGEWIPKDED